MRKVVVQIIDIKNGIRRFSAKHTPYKVRAKTVWTRVRIFSYGTMLTQLAYCLLLYWARNLAQGVGLVQIRVHSSLFVNILWS